MVPSVKYIPDTDVSPAMDTQLRELLSVCFTKPEDIVFRERRYFHEMPKRRFYITGENERIIAHTAVHEKHVISDKKKIPFGGIAEVCVHPEYRKRGYVKLMLAEAHRLMTGLKFPYAILIGDAAYYQSSGYDAVRNIVQYHGSRAARQVQSIRVKTLSAIPWPEERLELPGPVF